MTCTEISTKVSQAEWYRLSECIDFQIYYVCNNFHFFFMHVTRKGLKPVFRQKKEEEKMNIIQRKNMYIKCTSGICMSRN